MVLAVQKKNGPTERRRKRSIGQTVALRSELSGVDFFRSTSLQFDDSGALVVKDRSFLTTENLERVALVNIQAIK